MKGKNRYMPGHIKYEKKTHYDSRYSIQRKYVKKWYAYPLHMKEVEENE